MQGHIFVKHIPAYEVSAGVYAVGEEYLIDCLAELVEVELIEPGLTVFADFRNACAVEVGERALSVRICEEVSGNAVYSVAVRLEPELRLRDELVERKSLFLGERFIRRIAYLLVFALGDACKRRYCLTVGDFCFVSCTADIGFRPQRC